MKWGHGLPVSPTAANDRNRRNLVVPESSGEGPLTIRLPTFVIVHLPTVYPGIEPKKEAFSDFRDLRRLCHIHHKSPAPFSPFANRGVRMFKQPDRPSPMFRTCTIPSHGTDERVVGSR